MYKSNSSSDMISSVNNSERVSYYLNLIPDAVLEKIETLFLDKVCSCGDASYFQKYLPEEEKLNLFEVKLSTIFEKLFIDNSDQLTADIFKKILVNFNEDYTKKKVSHHLKKKFTSPSKFLN